MTELSRKGSRAYGQAMRSLRRRWWAAYGEAEVTLADLSAFVPRASTAELAAALEYEVGPVFRIDGGPNVIVVRSGTADAPTWRLRERGAA